MAFILFEKAGQIFNFGYINRFVYDFRYALWRRQPAKGFRRTGF
jgi:hypothetical protein